MTMFLSGRCASWQCDTPAQGQQPRHRFTREALESALRLPSPKLRLNHETLLTHEELRLWLDSAGCLAFEARLPDGLVAELLRELVETGKLSGGSVTAYHSSADAKELPDGTLEVHRIIRLDDIGICESPANPACQGLRISDRPIVPSAALRQPRAARRRQRITMPAPPRGSVVTASGLPAALARLPLNLQGMAGRVIASGGGHVIY